MNREEKAKRPRRLVLFGPNGSRITMDMLRKHPVGELDLTGIPNADSSAPLVIIIEEQCDLGAWHQTLSADLPCWDER